MSSTGNNEDDSKIKDIRKNYLMVAAIDFGTTYSGFAVSMKSQFKTEPLKIQGKVWPSSDLLSEKTPTTILLDDGGKFEAFGYEAEDQYIGLAEDEDHVDHYYFRRFKMMLYDKHNEVSLTRDSMLQDMTGKDFKAINVFSRSIEYMKKEITKQTETKGTLVSEREILWVLTVPAIWNDPAKQFMREAAVQAGIPTEQLVIALEPEAASIYCKYIPVQKLEPTSKQLSAFHPGSQYLILDAGGGTVDVTVHKVTPERKLVELDKASGGDWGGTKVDEAFKTLLGKITSPAFIEEYALTKEYTADYIVLFRDFELKKRVREETESSMVTLKIPVSLGTFYEEKFEKTLSDRISEVKEYAGKIVFLGDKMRMSVDIFEGMFRSVCSGIVQHLKKLLVRSKVKGTDVIIMVGGFSQSPILQEEIKKNFPQCRIIIPPEAGLAVLYGAVLFGHNPYVISARVAKYTYGISTNVLYDDKLHKGRQKKMVNGKAYCPDVFSTHVTQGETIDIDEKKQMKSYYPMYEDQTSMELQVFISLEDHPQYTDDPSCRYVGKLCITLYAEGDMSERKVSARMTFGWTELKVEGIYKGSDGKTMTTDAKFDFLDIDKRLRTQ